MKFGGTRRARTLVVAVVVILLAAVLIGALFGKARARTIEESTAVILVIPPGAGNPDAKLNPFVNIDSNMVQLALALKTAVNSPQTEKDLGPDAPTITSMTADTVKTAAATAGSGDTAQLQLTVQGTDGRAVRQTTQKLTDYTRTLLRRMQQQAGVKGATFADTAVEVEPTDPEQVTASTTRSIIASAAVALLGTAIGLALIAAVGRYILRRRPDAVDGTEEDLSDHHDDGPEVQSAPDVIDDRGPDTEEPAPADPDSSFGDDDNRMQARTQ